MNVQALQECVATGQGGMAASQNRVDLEDKNKEYVRERELHFLMNKMQTIVPVLMFYNQYSQGSWG